MSFTSELLEEFESVVDDGDLLESYENDLRSCVEENSFPVAEIDFDEVFHHFEKDSQFKEVRDILGDRNTKMDYDLYEYTLDVMASSKFEKFVNHQVQLGAWDRCMNRASFGLMDCVQTIRVGCNQTTITDTPMVPDLADEACELEPTRIKSVDEPDWLDLPRRQKRKFAFGITREFFCSDPNRFFIRMMERGMEAFDLRKEKIIADNLAALFPRTATGQMVGHQNWYFNGHGWNPYQVVGSGGPYENFWPIEVNPATGQVVNDDDPNICSCGLDPLCVIERYEEDWVDPKTCEPVECPDPRQLLVASEKTARIIGPKLGSYSIEYDSPTGPNGEKCGQRWSTNQGPREGWDGNIKYSKYLRRRLLQYYVHVVGCTIEEARRLADKFFIAGRFQRAAAWLVEWERETLTRADRNQWENFNQEIVWLTKFMEKASFAWLDPRLIQIFFPVKAVEVTP